MSNCKPFNTPCEVALKFSTNSTQKKVDGKLCKKLVGNLLYLTITRKDIAYAVGVVSKYMEDPHIEHWRETKRILRQIKGLTSLALKTNIEESLLQLNIQILIMQVTSMIEIQLLGSFSILDQDQFHGAVRSNQQCDFHQQKLNILAHQRHLKKHCGLGDYLKN